MKHRRSLVISLVAATAALVAPCAAIAAQDDEPLLRLYDLRDLAAVLPGSDGSALAEDLVSNICGSQGLWFEILAPSIVSVEGAPEEHERLQDQLRRLQTMYDERFEVALSLFELPRDDAPELGATVKPGEALVETRQVVHRRKRADFESITRHTYVSDVIPIVGDGAMGYDPETAHLDEGLELTLVVGAGEERKGALPIRASGRLTRVSLSRTSAPLWPGAERAVTIDLPTERRRSIETTVWITPGRKTAISVIDGFEHDTVIVLAASIRRLD